MFLDWLFHVVWINMIKTNVCKIEAWNQPFYLKWLWFTIIRIRIENDGTRFQHIGVFSNLSWVLHSKFQPRHNVICLASMLDLHFKNIKVQTWPTPTSFVVWLKTSGRTSQIDVVGHDWLFGEYIFKFMN